MKRGYVYIMSNFTRTTFYVGVTNNIERRVGEHREGHYDGFTKRYRLKYLVYLEEFESIIDAIRREKQLKNWHRAWKLSLIRKMNPAMRDLAEGLFGQDP